MIQEINMQNEFHGRCLQVCAYNQLTQTVTRLNHTYIDFDLLVIGEFVRNLGLACESSLLALYCAACGL